MSRNAVAVGQLEHSHTAYALSDALGQSIYEAACLTNHEGMVSWECLAPHLRLAYADMAYRMVLYCATHRTPSAIYQRSDDFSRAMDNPKVAGFISQTEPWGITRREM